MSFTPGAGTRFLLFGSQPLSGGTISGNSSASFLDISGTWNTTGTPTGIRLNVTDTASNAASLLMDLQVGGVSRASVRKDGRLTLRNGHPSVGVCEFVTGDFDLTITHSNNTVGFFSYGFQLGTFSTRNTVTSSISIGGNLTTDPQLIFGSRTTIFGEASNTLAQRNGVNAQTLRVYNTFTDASNYERGGLAWSGNRLNVFTENAGTGLARTVGIGTSGSAPVNIFTVGIDRWQFKASGTLVALLDNAYDIGEATSGRPKNGFWAGYQQLSEMTAPAAPAADSVRIYAEDNGSGKTRLMALFATGAAQQIAIEP